MSGHQASNGRSGDATADIYAGLQPLHASIRAGQPPVWRLCTSPGHPTGESWWEKASLAVAGPLESPGTEHKDRSDAQLTPTVSESRNGDWRASRSTLSHRRRPTRVVRQMLAMCP